LGEGIIFGDNRILGKQRIWKMDKSKKKQPKFLGLTTPGKKTSGTKQRVYQIAWMFGLKDKRYSLPGVKP
jgi:hypothetical protein